jgi:hypothetical protein
MSYVYTTYHVGFSYWFDKPRFLTEGKLATVLIIPSSWSSQLGGYLPTSIAQACCTGLVSALKGHLVDRGILHCARAQGEYNERLGSIMPPCRFNGD